MTITKQQSNLENVYALAALRIGVVDHEQLFSLALVVHPMGTERRTLGKSLKFKARRFRVLLIPSTGQGDIGNARCREAVG